MTTQYTPILQLALPVTGELNGTWGDVVNDNITSMVEEAIAGLATISTWTTNAHTLTTADGVTDEARCAMLVLQTGAGGTALSGAGQVICPARTKLYVVKNDAAYAVTVKTSGGSGVAIAAGDTAFVFCDGTNVNSCVTQIINGHITGNLTVDGNTTLGDAFGDTVTINAGSTTINDGGAIRFEDNAGGEYVAIKAPATVTATYTLTLPIDDGVNGQALITDGNGNLSWSTAASGDVYGPASATDNAVARFDLTTGKIIQNSGVIIDDSNNVTGVVNLTSSGSVTISGGTANGVAYLNGSKVLTTGGALIFNGTKLGVGLAPTAFLDVLGTAGTSTLFRAEITGTAQINIGNGGASTNYYDANTQIFRNGSGASEQMRLTSTGLGIGTSSPSGRLHLGGDSPYLYIQDTVNPASDVGMYFGAPSAATYAGILTNFASDQLLFRHNSATRMTIDASGNLGLGVTPSAWWAGNKAMQIGQGGVFEARTGSPLFTIGSNYFLNSSLAYTYINTAAASRYEQTSGQHAWFTAPSGTAGNAISFTQAMTLDASGKLGVGITSPSQTLSVNAIATISDPLSSVSQLTFGDAASDYAGRIFYNHASDSMQIFVNAAERMRIDSSGNVGIGTSSPGATLDINGSLKVSDGVGTLYFPRAGVVGNVARSLSVDSAYSSGIFVNNSTSSAQGGLVSAGDAARLGISAGNFGIATDGAKPILFAINSAERMRIDSSGNLGLGVTPSAWYTATNNVALQFGTGSIACKNSGTLLNQNGYTSTAGGGWKYIGNDYATSYAQTGGQHQWYTAPSGTAGNAISWTQAMTLDASGNLGIGTTTTTAGKLIISSDGGNVICPAAIYNTYSTAANSSSIDFWRVSTRVGQIVTTLTDFGLNASSSMYFQTGGTERMRIDSSGNVCINTTSTVDTSLLSIVQPNTKNGISIQKTQTGSFMAMQFFYGGTRVGSIQYSDTATAFNTSSDYRLKENIQPMQNALGVVAQLNPVTYTWKADGSDGQGFIAHELQAVVPDCVTGEKDAVDAEGKPVYQGIDTSFLVATLTKAIQEQQELINQLTARVAQLEGN